MSKATKTMTSKAAKKDDVENDGRNDDVESDEKKTTTSKATIKTTSKATKKMTSKATRKRRRKRRKKFSLVSASSYFRRFRRHCFFYFDVISFIDLDVVVFSPISMSSFSSSLFCFVRMGTQLHRAARSGAIELIRVSDLCPDFFNFSRFPASAETFLKPPPIFAPIRMSAPTRSRPRPATFCRLAYKAVCRVLFGSHQRIMSLTWRCAGALGRLLPALRPSPAAQLRCSSASTTGSGSDSGLYEPEGIKEPWIPEYQPRSDEHMETKRSR